MPKVLILDSVFVSKETLPDMTRAQIDEHGVIFCVSTFEQCQEQGWIPAKVTVEFKKQRKRK